MIFVFFCFLDEWNKKEHILRISNKLVTARSPLQLDQYFPHFWHLAVISANVLLFKAREISRRNMRTRKTLVTLHLELCDNNAYTFFVFFCGKVFWMEKWKPTLSGEHSFACIFTNPSKSSVSIVTRVHPTQRSFNSCHQPTFSERFQI